MLSPGAAIGRYVIQKKLAEGGMAEVYLASAVGPEGFAKDVVIKVVRSFLASDQQFIDMFVAEARLSSRLNHANVVQIFDFGKADDSYYLAMEYVRGASLWDLRKRCRERGIPFPSTLAAEIGAQVARGLQYAHTLTERGQPLGLVHRDVTPHNVLLSFDGAVKLTDFGIAKAGSTQTAPGMLKGKFAYMSPEQAQGESVDARTDVFALGIVLWELLTGGRLFEAESELAVLKAVQSATIVPPTRLNPEVPEALSDIVLKALTRPLTERFQSAFELERALAMFVLQHAKSVDDSSAARFLQQMFQAEYQSATHGHAPSDELAHGATIAVERQHLPTGASPLRRAGAQDQTHAPGTPEPSAIDQPAAPPKTAVMAGVRASRKLPEVVPAPVSAPSPTPMAAPMAATLPDREDPEPSAVSVETDVADELPRGRGALGLVVAALSLAAMASATWVLTRTSASEVEPVALPLAAPVAAVNDEPAPVIVDPSPVKAEVPSPTASPLRRLEEDTVDAGASAAKGAPKVASPATAMGVVELRAVPYATLLIDGRKAGEVQGTRRVTLPAGRHEVTFIHPVETRREPVVITPGQTVSVTFDARANAP